MTQEITVVPVDNRTADWPRKVATVLNRLQRTTMLAGGSAVWGSITGTLSAQTDLNSALAGKQATLVSGTNIKSVNGSSLLGSGNLSVGTVTSVAASVPTGFSVAGSPITGSGTLAITFSAGYSLPTDAAQTNWNTAFGWGNHASAGYLTSSAIGSTVQAYDVQLDSLAALSYSGNALKVVRINAGATGFELATVSGGLSDGDYGDITVGGSGTSLTIDNDVVTYAKMQNVSATSRILGRKTASAGDAEECTLSEILDFIGSAAQGDILYRGASGWARLGAGTSGQVLQTNGAGANPSWVTPSGGGGNLAISLPNMRALTDFTQLNIGGARTCTEASGKAITIAQAGLDTTLRIVGLRRAAPTPPYRVAVFVQMTMNPFEFVVPSFGFSDGTKYETVLFLPTSLEVDTWSNSTTRASATTSLTGRQFEATGTGTWYGFRDDNAGNVYWEMSQDGVYWTTIRGPLVKSTGYLGSSGYTNLFVGPFFYQFGAGASNYGAMSIRCWDENGLSRTF